jgi:hypothetical protein
MTLVSHESVLRPSERHLLLPQNFEEAVVGYYIVGTYLVYFMGVQYIITPLIGWFLGLYVVLRIFFQHDGTPPEKRITVPWGVWVWIFAMMVMLMALIIGHIDFKLSTWRLIKSIIDQFPRTWGLLAVFPLVGCLNIRPQFLYRAACLVCVQHLIFLVIGYVAHLVGIDGFLYSTPLSRFGGGADMTNVILYVIDDTTGGLRLQLNTPFAPALGLLGNVYFWLCLQEQDKKWRWIGVIASILMVWFSVSRTGRICMILIPFGIWFLTHVRRPVVQLAAAVACFVTALSSTQLIYMIQDYTTSVKQEREGSTRIRIMLRRMALQRWQEAPIWGHGVPDTGIRIVRNKGIGSHGIWHGIFFVHGLVGFLALAVPMICSAIDLLPKIQQSSTARVGLAVLLVLAVYGFSENFEGQAYLFYPGLIALGMGLKERIPVITERDEAELVLP